MIKTSSSAKRQGGWGAVRKKLEAAIMRIREKDRRWVFLVGIAKHSKVISRYQLAMVIEKIMPPDEARYVKIPRELEAKAKAQRAAEERAKARQEKAAEKTGANKAGKKSAEEQQEQSQQSAQPK